eukprot:ANDGO_06799.mRNA.1 Transmembrane protein 104 homolog
MAGGSVFGSYNKIVGFVYVFNLIVGMGALALPLNVYYTGVILGAMVLLLLAALAFMTVTFVIESMSNANALKHANALLINSEGQSQTSETPLLGDHRHDSPPPLETPSRLDAGAGASAVSVSSEDALSKSSGSPFDISTRFEMVKMAVNFLGRKGQVFFYVVLIVYLFGDLAIYAVSVPLSLQRVTGPISDWSEINTYRFYLFLFSLVTVPFTFFDMQSSKFLQLATLGIRNVAFLAMIILAFIRIGEGNGASREDVPYFDFSGIPKLYGVAVYAFMCHHSLPAIVDPIRQKKGIFRMFLGDFMLVYVSYIMLCFSAVYAFASEKKSTCGNSPGEPCKLQQLYTLNFSSYQNTEIAHFLALFPCFTLTTNFPLICITLRNNVAELVFPGNPQKQQKWKGVFAAVCATPPILIAFGTQSVGLLVNITGSFAGVGIQYVLPALFVFFSRKMVRTSLPGARGPFSSPFRSVNWIYFILIWSVLTIIMALYNLINTFVNGG